MEYYPGDKMARIDALSRAPFEQPTDTGNELIDDKMGVMLTMIEEEYVITMQRSDQRLREIIDILTKPDNLEN